MALSMETSLVLRVYAARQLVGAMVSVVDQMIRFTSLGVVLVAKVLLAFVIIRLVIIFKLNDSGTCCY